MGCRWQCNDNCDINNEGDNDDDSIHNHENDNSDNYSDDSYEFDFVITGLGIFAFRISYRLEIVKQ